MKIDESEATTPKVNAITEAIRGYAEFSATIKANIKAAFKTDYGRLAEWEELFGTAPAHTEAECRERLLGAWRELYPRTEHERKQEAKHEDK